MISIIKTHDKYNNFNKDRKVLKFLIGLFGSKK